MNSILLAGIAWHGVVSPLSAQFSSGSSGSDGELTFPQAKPGDIVLFDPSAFNPSQRQRIDQVYQFTTIRIPKDVTIKLSASLLNGPVFWLAQGPVEIEGTIDLTGGQGTDQLPQQPSVAGAGGYGGGVGASRKNPPQQGYGPGGGASDAKHAGGQFTGNKFLVPLIGGSGGSGGGVITEEPGCTGGAGGGALLIASSVSITVNGRVLANGGNSSGYTYGCGGGGSGGAIRLAAPLIAGSGVLSAGGGRPGGGDGWIRFEASENQFAGLLNNTPVSLGKPFGLFLPPSPEATVQVVSINGVPLAQGGHAPAISINQTTPVTVAVEARFIPPGTIIELDFFSEDGVRRSVSTTPLQGSLDRSTAEASVVFPTGLTHCHVKASWRQPPMPSGNERKQD